MYTLRVIIAATLCIVFIWACSGSKTTVWHKYGVDRSEVIEVGSPHLEVESHRWTLIGKGSASLESNCNWIWEWEVTIRTTGLGGAYVSIGSIEYALQDQQNSDLVTSYLNPADYDKQRIVFEDKTKGPIMQKIGTTSTYKGKGVIPCSLISKIDKTTMGRCLVKRKSSSGR